MSPSSPLLNKYMTKGYKFEQMFPRYPFTLFPKHSNQILNNCRCTMIKRSLRSKNLISRMGVLEPHNSSIVHETSTILHSCKLKEETKQTRIDICHKEPCVLLLSSDCVGQQMGTTARF